MSYCISNPHPWRVIAAAVLFAALPGCLDYNDGDNGFPKGLEVTGNGPYEEAPFQLCDDTVLWDKSSLVVAKTAGSQSQSCTVDDDCNRRQECVCGICVPRFCTSFNSLFRCGIDFCVDGNCSQVCEPSVTDACGEGRVCSTEKKVCRNLCETDGDCLTGEVCEQTDDGMACIVRQYNEGMASRNREPLVMRNGMTPTAPSGWVDGGSDDLVLWFGVQSPDEDQLYLYRATGTQPSAWQWRQLIMQAHPQDDRIVLDAPDAAPGMLPVDDGVLVFYDTADGIMLRKTDHSGHTVEDDRLVVANTGDMRFTHPAPVRTSRGVSLYMGVTGDGLHRADSEDGDLTRWTLQPVAALEPDQVETSGGALRDPCMHDSNCGEGLYCYLREEVGQCVYTSCGEPGGCGGGFECKDDTCVCNIVEGCPRPNPTAIWINLGHMGEPFATYDALRDITHLFFIAEGRSSRFQPDEDFSIGIVTFDGDGAMYPGRGNPLFDLSYLSWHFDEHEPAVIPMNGGYLMLFSNGSTFLAARSPLTSRNIQE